MSASTAPPPAASPLIRGEQEAVDLQHEIVRAFFPRSPVLSSALAAQRRNNKRLIGVHDGNRVVGCCALWPVKEATAAALLHCTRIDDDVTLG